MHLCRNLVSVWLAVLWIMAGLSPLAQASPQSLLEVAKATLPDHLRNRSWTRVAYTEVQFKARPFTWGNSDPPALVSVPLSPGLVWVIFYSNPQNSASVKNTGGGADWSPVGQGLWGFHRPKPGEAGYGHAESLETFILRPHSNLKGFEAGIHVTLDSKGAMGGDQRAGVHTLEILFSPDGTIPPGSSGVTPSGGGSIRHQTQLCLDVYAPCQNNNGCNVQMWACNGALQQQWTISGNTIKSGTGKCLDVYAPCQRHNGCNVQVWDCNGSPQQTWTRVGDTWRSGAGLCLDVHAPCQNNNGCNVQVWACNGAPQQNWRK